MLVLTRKQQQQLQIGEQGITVTVLEVRPGRVRLGIEAPSHVSIRRREVEVPVEDKAIGRWEPALRGMPFGLEPDPALAQAPAEIAR